MTTGSPLPYRYACFIDGDVGQCCVARGGEGRGGDKLAPFSALYRNNERGGKGGEEKTEDQNY